MLLVVGDVMLDQFVYGEVRRISPEAPTPVLLVRRRTSMPGGAGNVARGIAALGASCLLVSVIGVDEEGSAVGNALLGAHVDPFLLGDAMRNTTTKTRYVSIEHSSHLLRVDEETAAPLSDTTQTLFIRRLMVVRDWRDIKCVVLSDYGKGVLRPAVVKVAMDLAGSHHLPIIVDTKRSDWSVYSGATALTPNLRELGLPHDASNGDILDRARQVREQFRIERVLVTCGDRGMMCVGDDVFSVPAHPVKVRDVSGAGDTVVATLAVALSEGADFETAVHMANDAAAISVGKYGTATVTRAELTSKGKIVPVDDWTLLDQRIAEWRKDGERIGFVNGCFDLIHPGHVRLLQEARAMCDRLVVGLNSDESVRALKGENRPVQGEKGRAEILAAMDAVDLVVIFSEETPLRLIEHVTPDVLVKGSDYKDADVVGSDIAKNVVFVDRSAGYSTTQLIERIQ